MQYTDFLARKIPTAKRVGFEPTGLPEQLFPWQERIVRQACLRGRSAIFAGCGLGKTAMQLAWADQVVRHTGQPVLILTPLAVAPQTVAEAKKFGLAARVIEQEVPAHPEILITNYQKLLSERRFVDFGRYGGVVPDESSILKSYMGKTKRLLIEAFRHTPYRLACTATPAPNDHMELGNHAEFLGIMDSNEMLSRWFIADQGEGAGHYRLKGHAEDDFWRWVASWAVCLERPSDLGYEDCGFALPPLEFHQHWVAVDATEGRDEGCLWRSSALTATGLHGELRMTAGDRADEVAAIITSQPHDTWIVWCNTNYEEDAITKHPALQEAIKSGEIVAVRGSTSDKAKEELLSGFASGRHRVLVTKPSIAGFGLNWQHCAHVVFMGLSYSHEQFYQAIRRSWRFGQNRPVHCHLIVADTEGDVLATLKRKEEMADQMRAKMIAATRSAETQEDLTLREVETGIADGQNWTLHLGDCVDRIRRIADDSVGFTIFSPPFCSLYIYSDVVADMGNSGSDEEFFEHFGYLVPQLLRVTVPGRLCAVHCKDLPKYAGRDGIAGLKDFPGAIVALFERHGWSFHSRVTIWKCPVVERERTNNNGLLHKTVRRDSSQVRQGMADYLLVFRRPPRDGDGLMSAEPIAREEGLDRWVGDQVDDPANMPMHPSKYARTPAQDRSIALWQRYAEPVWWDIDQTDTLNERVARESRDEKHICPLQLGLIRRAIYLWSQPGDLVLSPFAGIGSEGVVAVQEGRRFVGIELKRAYWAKACSYLGSIPRDLFAGEGNE